MKIHILCLFNYKNTQRYFKFIKFLNTLLNTHMIFCDLNPKSSKKLKVKNNIIRKTEIKLYKTIILQFMNQA